MVKTIRNWWALIGVLSFILFLIFAGLAIKELEDKKELITELEKLNVTVANISGKGYSTRFINWTEIDCSNVTVENYAECYELNRTMFYLSNNSTYLEYYSVIVGYEYINSSRGD